MGYLFWHPSVALVACPFCGQERGQRCASRYDAQLQQTFKRAGLLMGIRYAPVHKARIEAAEREQESIERVWAS